MQCIYIITNNLILFQHLFPKFALCDFKDKLQFEIVMGPNSKITCRPAISSKNELEQIKNK